MAFAFAASSAAAAAAAACSLMSMGGLWGYLLLFGHLTHRSLVRPPASVIGSCNALNVGRPALPLDGYKDGGGGVL